MGILVLGGPGEDTLYFESMEDPEYVRLMELSRFAADSRARWEAVISEGYRKWLAGIPSDVVPVVGDYW